MSSVTEALWFLAYDSRLCSFSSFSLFAPFVLFTLSNSDSTSDDFVT
jgi:hypothetical protein